MGQGQSSGDPASHGDEVGAEGEEEVVGHGGHDERVYSGLIDHGGSEERPVFIKAARGDASTPLKVYTGGEGRLAHAWSVKAIDQTPVKSLSQVMALDKGGKVLLRTPAKDSTFLGVNVETGQTTDEVAVTWKSKQVTLQSMTPQKRHAQYVDEGPVVELFGIAGGKSNTLWAGMYDPRAGETNGELKVGSKSANQFATIQFTCCATTRLGYMVTGDVKGNVRLYRDVDRALSVLSGYGSGEPIIGVDVTADGKFVMWTISDAIYMVNYPDGEEAWGARGVPPQVPVKLVVREQAMKQILDQDDNAEFLPAKFDLGTIPDGSKSSIIGMTEKIYVYVIRIKKLFFISYMKLNVIWKIPPWFLSKLKYFLSIYFCICVCVYIYIYI
jgi:hypothetical protein